MSAAFVDVMREASTGKIDPEGTAAVQLQNALDPLREIFRDADDASTVLVVAGAAVAVTLVLLAALPQIVFLLMKPPVARDAFLLATRLSAFDPRMLAAAIAAGVGTAWVVARVMLGSHAGPWIRGTLRGWHSGGRPLADRLRRVLALAVGRPAAAAAIFAVALLASLPSARDQTTVDPRGVHAFGPLFLVDRETAWAQVTAVEKIPAAGDAHREGFAVVIRAADAVVVSTADLRLQNGTDAYFYDMVERWRR